MERSRLAEQMTPPVDPPADKRSEHPSDRSYPPELEGAEAKLIELRRARASGEQKPPDDPDGRKLPPDTVGIALSGGGIRSATFCLGVLQSLARNRLLGKIDFLSTVSGGGYIGSFLGRMFTRDWAPDGEDRSVDVVQNTLGDGESEPMRWLRDNGRYLSPNRAGDAWLAVAIFLRNWLSVLTVLLLLAFAVFSGLTLARAALWRFDTYVELVEKPLLGFAGPSLWWSPIAAIAVFVFAVLLVPVWAYWLTQITWSDLPNPLRWVHKHISIISTVLIVVVSLLAMLGDRWKWFPVSLVLVVIVSILLVGGFTALATAAVLGLKPESDKYLVRNRLSRALAAGVQVFVLLSAVTILDTIGQSTYALIAHEEGLVQPLGMLVGLTGLAAVAAFAQKITQLFQKVAGGRFLRLPVSVLAAIVGGALAVIFLSAVSVGVHAVSWGGRMPMPTIGDSTYNPGESLATHLEDRPASDSTARGEYLLGISSDKDRTGESAGRSGPHVGGLLIAFTAAAFLSLLFGQILAFFNLSSFHAFYAARLSRAYLGASNVTRWADHEDEKGYALWKPAGTRVGDPIKGDDCDWDEYRPWDAGGPLHIVNMTLNETVSGKSQVEYRDRKGLIMAVGPTGISVGRHDHGLWGQHGTDANEEVPPEKYLTWITPIDARPRKFHALGLAAEGKTGRRYGQANLCEKAKLGRYVAISGAAFTTGLGSRTSFGTSLLMGLFNVRLGYWWTCGISHSDRKNSGACSPPRVMSRLESFIGGLLPVQTALLGELTARFHGPSQRRWYLSDGGHYENTGAYELIRRKVPWIIVCDCGCDLDYQFEDIANLARKARIDFGVELEFLDNGALKKAGVPKAIRKLLGTPKGFESVAGTSNREDGPSRTERHAMLAWVDYEGKQFADRSRADRTAGTGSLVLFLKPSVTGDEPIDVLRYQSKHADFPQETTADQFFDEAQWESYRKLGEHISDQFLSIDFPDILLAGQPNASDS